MGFYVGGFHLEVELTIEGPKPITYCSYLKIETKRAKRIADLTVSQQGHVHYSAPHAWKDKVQKMQPRAIIISGGQTKNCEHHDVSVMIF